MEIEKIIRSNGYFKVDSFVSVTNAPITDKNIHLKTVRDEFQDIYTALSFTQSSAIRKQTDTKVRWSVIPGSLKAMMKNGKDSEDILNLISNPVTKTKHKNLQQNSTSMYWLLLTSLFTKQMTVSTFCLFL